MNSFFYFHVIHNIFFEFQVQTKGGKSLSRRDFGLQLVENLVKHWAFSRLHTKTMPREIKFLIGSVFAVDPEPPADDPPDNEEGAKKRQRCRLCPKGSNKKSKMMCADCNRHICQDHHITVCKNCKQL